MPDPVPHMSPDEFRAAGHRVIDWIADYMRSVEAMPVLSQVKPGEILAKLPAHPPEQGTPANSRDAAWNSILSDLSRTILPGLTHWQSPNFYAYFPCNASGPAILGELLSAGLNVNGMLWLTSPAATELEIRMMDWMAELLGLPHRFFSTSAGGGCIQGTASESTLVAMAAARHRAASGTTNAATSGGAGGGAPTVYASTQAHSSVVKAAMIAGIARGPDDRESIRLIDTDANHAMRPDLLAGAIREDLSAGRTPIMVTATVGTTSSTAIDPVDKIGAAIRESCHSGLGQSSSGESSPRAKTPPWLHVDAAHAAAACICPEFRWMLAGAEHADSLCFNPHKWLLTNFDCDCFWVADRRALTDAMSVTPEYLRNKASEAGEVTDFRDWGIPLGRRFRALKLWMVIRHYGAEGLRAYVREHIRLASLFEELVRADPRFEVAAPRTVNLVCFRLRGNGGGDAADARNRALMDRLNASGKLYLTHTVFGGRVVLRMAIGAATTREEHIRSAWDRIREAADAAR